MTSVNPIGVNKNLESLKEFEKFCLKNKFVFDSINNKRDLIKVYLIILINWINCLRYLILHLFNNESVTHFIAEPFNLFGRIDVLAVIFTALNLFFAAMSK